MRTNLLPLVLMGLVLAGCADPPAPPEPAVSAPAPAFLEVAWNECEAFVSGTTYPSGLVETRDNPSWPPAEPSEQGLTDVRFDALDCAEVTWGTFHGPFRMLFESQRGEASFPPDCWPSGSLSWMGVLQSLWVSDERLAAALADAFDGLPVRAADIEVLGQELSYEWQWNEKGTGHAPSRLQVAVDPAPSLFGIPLFLRLHWFNATGTSYLDVQGEYAVPADPGFSFASGNRFATGELAPPMVGSSLGAYAGQGERRTAGSVEGQVTRFGDHFCTAEIQ